MKAILIVLFVLTHLMSIGQHTNQSTCQDTTKYKVKTPDGDCSEIQIKVDGVWKTFSLIDETHGVPKCQCTSINLNDSGSKELVIFWENREYGSGGGFTFKGVKIWNLDNGTVIFNEIYSCSQESFGRHGGERFLIEYRKSIRISEMSISVSEEEHYMEWNNSDLSDLSENCELTNIEPGIYFIQNGIIIPK